MEFIKDRIWLSLSCSAVSVTGYSRGLDHSLWERRLRYRQNYTQGKGNPERPFEAPKPTQVTKHGTWGHLQGV